MFRSIVLPGGFTHLVKGGANASGEVSVVPKHSDHGDIFVAIEATGRRVGVREDVVVRGWENDLSIVCELSRGIPPSGEVRTSSTPWHGGDSPPISKSVLSNAQGKPPPATAEMATKSPPAANTPQQHPNSFSPTTVPSQAPGPWCLSQGLGDGQLPNKSSPGGLT